VYFSDEQIVSNGGSKEATTFYLVGDGGENMHYGSLPIGLNSEQDIIESLYLDFRNPLSVQDRGSCAVGPSSSRKR